MANLFYNISQVLGITIIHSLWQGLLIYIVLRLIFLSIPSLSSLKRYNLSSLALFCMTAWFVCTFYTESQVYDWSPSKIIYISPAAAGLNFHITASAHLTTTFYDTLKTYLPYISILYAIGLIINLSKLGLAWNKIRVIKKTMIAADTLQQRIDSISKQLNIKKRIQVSYSRMVDVPCVIGYFKPILLLPITLIFQLSAEEIETILLHELSHIKSNDYVVNIVQQIISVVLFFNPFAQLIGRIISTERENRCDDLVVETSGNPLTYAYALLKLEEARQGELKLALAATQNKHHLLTRIERIMKTKQPIGNIRHILLAIVIFAGSLSSIAWLNPEIKSGKIALKNTVHSLYAAVTTIKHEDVATKTPVGNQHKKQPLFKYVLDTTKQTQVDDTTKNKKGKIKIVVEDENGNKHEYSSVNDMPENVRNDFLKENQDANFKYNMDYKFADSAKFNQMEKFYSSPQWKEQVEAMTNNAMAMTKRVNSPEFKKRAEALQRQAEAMGKKVNSPEFKKQIEQMQKKGEEMAKYYESPKFKKQMEEIAKKGEEMSKYYEGPEFKKQVEDMAKMGAEFGTKFINSPEWKRVQEDIVKSAMDMAKEAGGLKYEMKQEEAKEKAERIEKREVNKKSSKEKAQKAEKKEQPEKPEATEKPDTGN
jgi:bla regulator protein BlaR1